VPVHLIAFKFLLLFSSPAGEGPRGWTDFRGPATDGHAGKATIPLQWSENNNVLWKTAIHDHGWSTPVVDQGRIFITTATDDGRKMSLLCVDAKNGRVLNDQEIFAVAKPQPKHPLNSYASPSPVVNDDHVFVHFGTYGTAGFDAESFEKVWERRDLKIDHIAGPGSSPILYQDLLILHFDGGDRQFVIALDQESGETVWETERSTDYGKLVPDFRKAYSTPIVIEVGGKPQLISCGAQRAFAYDPDTGDEIWSLRYEGFSMSSRPVFSDGIVYLNTGFNVPSLMAVRVDGMNDVTDSHVAWRYNKNMPTMPSPVLVDGRLFAISDAGILSCLDAKTGERIFRERVEGEYSASLLAADSRIYMFNREGLSTVIAAAPEFQVLAQNRLDDGFMSSPAVVGDTLFLRTKTHLYRIEEPAAKTPGS